MTAYSDTEKAVTAIKSGATDFIGKPWTNEKLLATLSAAMKLRLSFSEIERLEDQVGLYSGRSTEIIGESPAMREVFSTVERIKDTDANVLILGENGTGKDVVARLLYAESSRRGKPFVSIDLGSIPESLFEGELFGYEKGSFTGAQRAKAGRMEIASGGTLFLDEIGNLTLPMQAKLQHAMERAVIMKEGRGAFTRSDFLLSAPARKGSAEMLNLGDLERQAVERAMRLSEGNMNRASEMLGITRYALYRKFQKLGL